MRGSIPLPGTNCSKPKRRGLKVSSGIRVGGIDAGNHTRSLQALKASARRLREAVEAVKRRMAERERLVSR